MVPSSVFLMLKARLISLVSSEPKGLLSYFLKWKRKDLDDQSFARATILFQESLLIFISSCIFIVQPVKSLFFKTKKQKFWPNPLCLFFYLLLFLFQCFLCHDISQLSFLTWGWGSLDKGPWLIFMVEKEWNEWAEWLLLVTGGKVECLSTVPKRQGEGTCHFMGPRVKRTKDQRAIIEGRSLPPRLEKGLG